MKLSGKLSGSYFKKLSLIKGQKLQAETKLLGKTEVKELPSLWNRKILYVHWGPEDLGFRYRKLDHALRKYC